MNHTIKITVEVDGRVFSVHQLDNINGADPGANSVIRFWDFMRATTRQFGDWTFAELFHRTDQ